MHHAYYVAGGIDEGVEAALTFGEAELGLVAEGNPDVVVLRYQSFPVEEARKIRELVSKMPVKADEKLIVIAATRLFHEAQNALLKVFEEPAPGTYLVLVVPSEGIIIPTLRSRMVRLPVPGSAAVPTSQAHTFITASEAEREKIVGTILDRAKSDKPEEKQAARADALALANALATAAYEKRTDPTVRAFLADLNTFIPILHERSAPLKLIFEHLLLVTPSFKGK